MKCKNALMQKCRNAEGGMRVGRSAFLLSCILAFLHFTPPLNAFPLDGDSLQRALQVARSAARDRARFHAPYIVRLDDPLVEQVEVITEFRRMVLIAEDRLRTGDWMFARSTAEASRALAPWTGVLTISTRLRFNPLNVYATVPAYTIVLAGQGGVILPTATTATPLLSDPFPRRDGSRTILGAVIDCRFDAADVGRATREARVSLDGAVAAATSIDFGALE